MEPKAWVAILGGKGPDSNQENLLMALQEILGARARLCLRLISLSSSVKGGGFERKRRGGFERRSGGDAVEEERRRLGGPAVETGEGLGSENS
ncbi:hypothetical protein CMV_007771 [Castanea mollissima]|uniref:Uncharacterized protein n=1 Tax=Castanea mollissima TaxID=60419 RepID=A0A8J4VPX0_9ROSI|nr:hypothetical protein CMV_007771 [Castanea mollissima]